MKTSFVLAASFGVVAALIPSTAAASGEVDAFDKVKALYNKIDYNCCSNGDPSIVEHAFDKASVPGGYNPVRDPKAADLDPTWLPGIAKLKLTDETREAIVQAAINRTWASQCKTDYKSFRAGWKTIEDKYRPELEMLRKEKNYYRAVTGLMSLMGDVLQGGEQAKLTLNAEHPHQWTGLKFEIYAAIVEAHRVADRLFYLDAKLARVRDMANALATFGRSFKDDAFEETVFCASAQTLGTHKMGPLTIVTARETSTGAVLWPYSKEKQKAVKSDLAKLQIETAATLKLGRREGIVLLADHVSLDATHNQKGKLIHAKGFTVTKVKRVGASVELTATLVEKSAFSYGCTRSNRVDRVTDAGVVLYEQNCKAGTEEDTKIVQVTIADLPASVSIAKGDQVAVFGNVVTFTEKEAKTASSRTYTRNYVLKGKHLSDVLHDKKAVLSF